MLPLYLKCTNNPAFLLYVIIYKTLGFTLDYIQLNDKHTVPYFNIFSAYYCAIKLL